METVRLILYIAHMVALLAILAGPVIGAKGPLVQAWAARIQLLIGLGLVGIAEGLGWGLDYVWVAVKLVVALAVIACAEIGNAKHKRNGGGAALTWAAAGLAVVNVLVAFLWP